MGNYTVITNYCRLSNAEHRLPPGYDSDEIQLSNNIMGLYAFSYKAAQARDQILSEESLVIFTHYQQVLKQKSRLVSDD
jgi:hypothetical protein